MGSLFKSKIAQPGFGLLDGALNPKAPSVATPQQAQFETQIDNINGVTTRRVKQPDGSYAIVTDRTPLTAEEQVYQTKLTEYRDAALARINELSNNFDVASIPGLSDYIESQRKQLNTQLDSNITAQTASEERALSRFGVEDSTAAAQQRTLRSSTALTQRGQIENGLTQLAQQVRQQELGNQGSLYQIAAGGLAADKSQLAQAAQGLIASGLTQQANNQNYYNNVAGVQTANNKNLYESRQAGLANFMTLGALAAAPFTGGASLALLAAQPRGFGGR